MNVMTMNIRDFCSMLTGISSIPNLDQVLIQFSSEGMSVYAKPLESPVMVNSFWSTHMFQDFYCPTNVSRWVSKERLVDLKRKISKDVDCLKIGEITANNINGFCFSGERTYTSGGKCKFTFNVCEWVSTIEPVRVNIKYPWHIVTASQKFSHNVDFIDDKNDFLSMTLCDDNLSFEGIGDTGLIGETITHCIETGKLPFKFNALFYKRYLKIITSAQALHKSLTISLNPDESEGVFPVLFSYKMDQNVPQSHFSVFVLPFVESSI